MVFDSFVEFIWGQEIKRDASWIVYTTHPPYDHKLHVQQTYANKNKRILNIKKNNTTFHSLSEIKIWLDIPYFIL